jgi:hypothetical protein
MGGREKEHKGSELKGREKEKEHEEAAAPVEEAVAGAAE